MSNETLARLLAAHQLEYFDGTCTGCDWDYANEPEGDDVELVIYHARHVAKLVTDAGYRKPRAIETDEGLDSLPIGTVISDAEDCIAERWGMPTDENHGWARAGNDFTKQTPDPLLPATVIYVPEEL